ncbi:MAG: CcmD family protein [Chitinophagaceae bacterium]
MFNALKKSFFLLPVLLLCSLAMVAQPVTDAVPEMADTMRSNGKIYVVVAVVITILAGVFFYLLRLERKINKLEKEG